MRGKCPTAAPGRIPLINQSPLRVETLGLDIQFDGLPPSRGAAIYPPAHDLNSGLGNTHYSLAMYTNTTYGYSIPIVFL